MDDVKKAIEALVLCEKSLRALLAKAAASGDYASVVRIASWAKTVSELTSGATGNPVHRTSREIRPGGKGREKQSNSYPRFFRQGDSLVKIAWSKRQKAEYQHKAPLSVLKAVADAMSISGKDGRVFSTDDFLPVSADGSEVPSYQAYLVIALLKQVGLIDQHGRQGYSISRLSEFKDAVIAVWKKLPTQ